MIRGLTEYYISFFHWLAGPMGAFLSAVRLPVPSRPELCRTRAAECLWIARKGALPARCPRVVRALPEVALSHRTSPPHTLSLCTPHLGSIKYTYNEIICNTN